MNSLRQAVRAYLDMRRGLGFKLREAGTALIDFVSFLDEHHTSYITQALALNWAQQPSHTQPAHWAQRLSFVRGFAHADSAPGPIAFPAETGAAFLILRRQHSQPTSRRAPDGVPL